MRMEKNNHPVKAEGKDRCVYSLEFDSQTDLQEVKASESNREWPKKIDEWIEKDGARWSGLKGVEQGEIVSSLKEVLLSGWKSGERRIRKVSDEISEQLPPVRHMKRRRKYGPEGSELDPYAIPSGRLDRAWSRMGKIEARGSGKAKRARLVINVSAPCRFTSSRMFWGPAAGLVMYERLVKRGMAVEVVAACCVRDINARSVDETYSSICVKVKDFNQLMNIGSLAILCLGGYFRKFFFDAWTSLPFPLTSNLGYIHNLREEVFPKFSNDKSCPTFYTNPLNNKREAVDFVMDKLKRINE